MSSRPRIDSELEVETLRNVENELVKFGLTSREAKIYVHLARYGPRKANKVAEETKMHRTGTYEVLTSLQNKGVVTATLERPITFIALPFAKAVEKIIEFEKERLFLAERRSRSVFDLWRSLPDGIDAVVAVRQFQIFEGVGQTYGRMNEILENVRSELSVMASRLNLARLHQAGVFDRVVKKTGVSTMLLTDDRSAWQGVVEKRGDLVLRVLPVDVKPVPHFILGDGRDVMFFTSREDAPRKDVSAIWTNYEAFGRVLHIMFDRLWEHSRPVDASERTRR